MISVFYRHHQRIDASLNPNRRPCAIADNAVSCSFSVHWSLTPVCFSSASRVHLNWTLVTGQCLTTASTSKSTTTTTIQCCNVVILALVASAWIQELSRTDVSLPLIEQKKEKMLYFMDCYKLYSEWHCPQPTVFCACYDYCSMTSL